MNRACSEDESSFRMKVYRLFRGKEEPSDKDVLLLTPFHLYKKYHYFPMKVPLHVFLVIFVSINALVLSDQYIGYGRANEQAFEAIFLPPSTRSGGIYSVPDTLDLISKTVVNYYAFPAVSVKRYAHILTDEEVNDGVYNIVPAKMTIVSYKDLDGSFWHLPCPDFNSTTANNGTSSLESHSSFGVSSSDEYLVSSEIRSLISDVKQTFVETSDPLDDDFDQNDISGDFTKVETEYDLTLSNPLGPLELPLSSCQLQHLFYKITEIRISFTYQAMNVGLVIVPYFWDIELVLTLLAGKVQPNIIITHRIANVIGFSSGDIFSILNGILFIISCLCFVLDVISCVRSIRIFLRTKNRYLYYQSAARPGDHFPSWTCIPFRVKPQFFSFWSASNSIGCLFLMASCFTGILEQWGKATSAWYLTLYGVGCILTSINLLRYFEYFPMLYLHVQTLRNASMHVLTYCISVMPIYWAFVIFGVLNFGPYSEKFSSVGQTIVTLFSLLNGDDIYATFQEIEEGQYPVPVISRFYIICFVTLFVTSVLNVFIFIIEDSYRTAKLTASHVGSWNGTPPTSQHLSMLDSGFTSREILQIIFHNLEIWIERMNQFPVVYGIEPPESDENSFMMSDFASDRGSDAPISILLEEFSDDSPEVFSGRRNMPIALNLSLDQSQLSSKETTVEDQLTKCQGNKYQLLELLQEQVQQNRLEFEEDLQRKEQELEEERMKFQEQENNLLRICEALKDSLES